MIGIKITAISTSRKIFIPQQIWKPIKKRVEKIVAVLTIYTALKLSHGNAYRMISVHTDKKIA